VSLLWAYGKLLQLQQQKLPRVSLQTGPGSSSSSSSSSRDSPSPELFVSKLCSHMAHLIQLSNNTADSATATTLNPATSTSAKPHPGLQNPSSSSSSSSHFTEPWHPDDLTDAVCGLAAAAGFRSTAAAQGLAGFSRKARAATASGFKSQAAACLLDAAAHEVYRQLSNRHSTAGSFTVEGVVAMLKAYCALDYKDGEGGAACFCYL